MQKLRDWGADSTSSKAIVARLVDEGYLDDAREHDVAFGLGKDEGALSVATQAVAA